MTEYVLYLPVIEPGERHDIADKNKRGLANALYDYGARVKELDYLDVPVENLFDEVMGLIEFNEPTLMLTQLHGVDRLTADNLAEIRRRYPALKIVNWSGDSWLHSLTSPEMLTLCKQFDLQLVAAPDVLPIYAENGIKAAFWQIAYEEPVGELPDMPHHDVVMLGNVICDKRRELFEFLRSLEGINVGIYGDWGKADGQNTYDFGAGEALYKNAKIAIADNVYPDQTNYVSNRPIQCLMAGGALLLHQRVDKMKQLLGIEEGVHYLRWTDFQDLEQKIKNHHQWDDWNREIVETGQQYVLEHHTYAHRVKQLFEELLPSIA